MPNANEVVLNYGHVITLHARKTTKLVVKAAYTLPRSAMVKVKAKRGVGRPDGMYHKIIGEFKVKVIDQTVHEAGTAFCMRAAQFRRHWEEYSGMLKERGLCDVAH